MEFILYKMHFKTGVHIGDGGLSGSEYTLPSDTFFSALCHETVKQGLDIKEWVNAVRSKELVFSDGLPFIESRIYIPKPLKPVLAEKTSSPKFKKAFKKLKYIPVDKLDEYMAGDLKADDEEKTLSGLGVFETHEKNSIKTYTETEPYQIGIYRFKRGNGIYFCVGYKKEKTIALFERLLQGLPFTGVGGKISSGYGKFETEKANVPFTMEKRLKSKNAKTYMTLSFCLPKENELESAMQNAYYLVGKRSGFVQSQNYAESFVKKKDMYLFRSGSCFSVQFEGDIYDVSSGGNHPVYRYGKPLFLEVD
jgi:CRISPR-associated protein Csm4